jgi:hypothetical protein
MGGNGASVREDSPCEVSPTAPMRIELPPNNSLQRTQPQRDFMYDVEMLRR